MDYTFTVTVQQAELVLGALNELPAKTSLGLINVLVGQVAEQNKWREAVKEKDVKKDVKK